MCSVIGHVTDGGPVHWAVSWDVTPPGISSTDLVTSMALMAVSPATGLTVGEGSFYGLALPASHRAPCNLSVDS